VIAYVALEQKSLETPDVERKEGDDSLPPRSWKSGWI